MMPEMDGFELLEALKSSEKQKQIPVIMLTSLTTESNRLKALQTGVDDYLTKPFSPPELLARVRNLIGNYKEKLIWREAFTEVQKPNLAKPSRVDSLIVEPNQVEIGEFDANWLQQFEQLITKHMGHHHISIADLADEMNLSQRQLSRKTKTLTGLTPLKYQQEVQLQYARQLLENKTLSTVKEVSDKSGFKTSSYFSLLFKERFGKQPSKY
jgi:DNA-binding response OmpR family regulator